MIAEGRSAHPRIEFVEANAEKLPFGDDEFDAVTISFGLRNVEHPKAALAEMYRVLKPGGRLVICEFSKPPRALFRTGYQAYPRFVMPVIANVASSNSEAYDYLRRVDPQLARPGHAEPVDPRGRLHPRRLPQPHRRRRRTAPRAQARRRGHPRLRREAQARPERAASPPTD